VSEQSPAPWIAVGNDYRGILDVDPVELSRCAVVLTGDGWDLPVVMSAIDAQDYEGEWKVLEAGDATEGHLAEFDVALFLRPGDLPGPGWLEAHARWHARASNVVVLGPSGDEARNALVRGTRRFLGNDEGFAAMTATNISLRCDAWSAISELDTIGGWQLWNDGCFFAYEPGATLSAMSEGQVADLSESERLALEDHIPQRRFRPQPASLHNVPKLSIVAPVETPGEATGVWVMAQRSSFADQEVVLFGPNEAVAAFSSLAASNPRVTVIAGQDAFGRAVEASRGELVALLHPGAGLAPETVSKAVARYDLKAVSPVVRVGYEIDGGRFLRLDDLAAIDRSMGRDGLPLFAVVTRRELMKDRGGLTKPETTWASLLDRCDQSLVVSPAVSIRGAAPIVPRRPGLTEASAVGARETAIAIVREARRRRASAGTAPNADHERDDRTSVAYVGFTGHDNLGDEAVRVAIERLMPWARFEAEPADPRLLMVGGGTLLNGRRYYLNRMLRQESASVERALFGTGVRSPGYWGTTEPMEEWFSFIDSCLFAALRGPDSVKNLRDLGYGRNLPVIGDPALSLEPQSEVARVVGRMVVCPVYTSGNLHGGSDEAVFDAIATLIGKARADGREIVMLSAFPQDDRWIIDMMHRAKAPGLAYVAGYADIDATMALLATADLVIAERLHAAIMAAAAGTPFVGLEYRPKMRDFARSVDQEAAIIRTDQMGELETVFQRVAANRDSLANDLQARVAKYRELQKDAAERLRSALMAR
jgi:Polysaccharide pyruvyl transferase